MMKKKTIRRSLSLLCVFALMLNLTLVASARDIANLEDSETVELEGYLYTFTRGDNGRFVITTSKDNILLNRVVMQKGQNAFTFEDYSKTTRNAIIPEIKYLSDYITYDMDMTSSVTTRANPYTPKSGSIGSVTYSAFDGSMYTYRLDFTSDYQDSVPGDFEVNALKNDATSIVIGAIVAGFGFAITGGLAEALLVGIIGTVGSQITDSFTAIIRGTAYLYNVTATAPDGRTHSEGGEVYNGDIKNGTWSAKTIYENGYPEFISKKDSIVARMFFDAFWYYSSVSVSKWSPA